MNKLAKIKLSVELLEAAANSVRSTAFDKIRWDDDAHGECDRWDDDEIIKSLTGHGREILDVAEELVARIEGLCDVQM